MLQKLLARVIGLDVWGLSKEGLTADSQSRSESAIKVAEI
jgi:hypothetical protein